MLSVSALVGCANLDLEKRRWQSIEPFPVELGGVKTEHHAIVTVVTEPRDAMVVVNRVPVGLAPQRLELPVTKQGFLADSVTITVRFVARDVTEASTTKTTTLYNTDRAPDRLEFSQEKVKRTFTNGTTSEGCPM
jgi:hypothetical protein